MSNNLPSTHHNWLASYSCPPSIPWLRGPTAAIRPAGMTLFPVQTHHPPAVRWMEPPPTVGEYYSVAIVDIDSPSRDDPKYRGWCAQSRHRPPDEPRRTDQTDTARHRLHWLVVNIPGERILEEAGLRVRPVAPWCCDVDGC